MRVLVVEDEQKVANALREGLEGEKYDVVVERTGEGAFFRVTTETFDVILLDLGLPGRSGLEILVALRERGLKTPVLVLTARDSVQDRVLGLDGGADDYLVKPFAFAELVARISALARRAAGPRWAPVTDVPLAMRDDLVVESGGRTVSLSPREYALFGCLLRRRGEVVARAEILRDAFGYEFDPGTNVIDVHLNHLRKKLQGFPVSIETVRGAGIRLVVSE